MHGGQHIKLELIIIDDGIRIRIRVHPRRPMRNHATREGRVRGEAQHPSTLRALGLSNATDLRILQRRLQVAGRPAAAPQWATADDLNMHMFDTFMKNVREKIGKQRPDVLKHLAAKRHDPKLLEMIKQRRNMRAAGNPPPLLAQVDFSQFVPGESQTL